MGIAIYDIKFNKMISEETCDRILCKFIERLHVDAKRYFASGDTEIITDKIFEDPSIHAIMPAEPLEGRAKWIENMIINVADGVYPIVILTEPNESELPILTYKVGLTTKMRTPEIKNMDIFRVSSFSNTISDFSISSDVADCDVSGKSPRIFSIEADLVTLKCANREPNIENLQVYERALYLALQDALLYQEDN